MRTTVKEAYKPLLDEEADRLIDEEAIVREAVNAVEQEIGRASCRERVFRTV